MKNEKQDLVEEAVIVKDSMKLKAHHSDQDRVEILGKIIVKLNAGPSHLFGELVPRLVEEARGHLELFLSRKEVDEALRASRIEAVAIVSAVKKNLCVKIRRFWYALDEYIEANNLHPNVNYSFGLSVGGLRPKLGSRPARWYAMADLILASADKLAAEEKPIPGPDLIPQIRALAESLNEVQHNLASVRVDEKESLNELQSLRKKVDVYLRGVRKYVNIASEGKSRAFERDSLRALGFKYSNSQERVVVPDGIGGVSGDSGSGSDAGDGVGGDV